jgi:hypothetical protein
MRKFLVVFSSLILSQTFAANAFADFNGKWQGDDGQMTGSEKASCGIIQIAITQTATNITIENSDYTCGPVTVNANTLELETSNGGLFLGGTQIGTIDATSFAYDITANGNSAAMKLNIKDGQLNFLQSLSMTGFGSYDIIATMTKQ